MTDVHRGLDSLEAGLRLKQYGRNQLPEQKRVTSLQIFLSQFSSFIVWVLIGAALISGMLREWIDASAIVVIVLLNAVLGFIQEYHAQKSLSALRKLSSPTSKVVRDGKTQAISSELIVPGDLVLLEAGDRVPADGTVVHSVQLAAQEAALTGESVPVEKSAELSSKVFMGTVITSGKGHVIVTETGLATELGKIANLLREGREEKTPLEIRLEQFGRRLVGICFGIVALVFLLGLLRGTPAIEMILTSLSLAVAAVPEGLPAVVTVALGVGVRKMAKRNALIRRLASVETLGCASVICTDKTGTLTQNEMTVTRLWLPSGQIQVTGVGYAPIGEFKKNGETIDPKADPDLMLALRIGILCNGAELNHLDGAWQVAGDPTEGAILSVAGKAGLKKSVLESEYPILGEIPFDSERKRMSVLRQSADRARLFVKGAPDLVLDRCTDFLERGTKNLLTDKMRQQITAANEQLAGQALRVLAVATRDVAAGQSIRGEIESGLTFVGLVAMIDPPRPEAKIAIQTCRGAGIRVVMITGDHKQTAIAVADELGLIEPDSVCLNGTEIEALSDAQLKEMVRKVPVYARVSAEHKLRIVKAWKALGEIVAMTGDGVNDAPAIQEADIGVAMGITGTDVAKESSDMVIADDNFSSIVSAVEEGRGIYDNIIKFVAYLLSSNIAELMIIFVAILAGFTDPQGNALICLSAVQLLWLNLVTDGFPAVALGLDPVDPHVMNRGPRHPTEPILSLRFGVQLFLMSATVAVGTLIACHSGFRQSVEMGRTVALTTLVVLELVRVQMIRSQYHMRLFSNRWLIVALTISMALQLSVVYFPPLQRIFGTVGLGFGEWSTIAVVAIGVWLAGILIDFFLRSLRWFQR